MSQEGQEPERIGTAREAEVLDVLCESFRDYPVMRFVLGSSAHYERELEVLIGFFLRARILREEPIFGLSGRDGLVAVALISEPGGPASPPELAEVRERTWAELGPQARARYDAFSTACQPLLSSAPRLHLNMIGVRRSVRGEGLGRTLLRNVHRLSLDHPTATGVSLTTENPENLRFYEGAGYALTGQAPVGPGLKTWAFFRANV